MELDKIKLEITQRYQMIIDYHKDKAKEHLEEVTKWENGLKVMLASDKVLSTIDNVFHGNSRETQVKSKVVVKAGSNKHGNNKSKSKRAKGETLEKIVTSYIQETDRPLNADAIREHYNNVKGSDISVANFSPRLSELKKRNVLGLFMNIDNGVTIKNKFLYGIPAMFEDIESGKLKLVYEQKAKAGHQAQLL